MNLPKSETAHLCAVLQRMILDLRDRSDVPVSACEMFTSRLAEGAQFLKELPLLGKAFDAFLMTDLTVDRTTHQCRLECLYIQALPIFGMQFTTWLATEEPENLSPRIVRAIRDISYLYYKYEAPYEAGLVQEAVDTFVSIDSGITPCSVDTSRDRALLEQVYRGIDLSNITPRHGPGTVADKAFGAFKYDWSAFPERLSNIYSYDYFVASYSHLAERWREFVASSSRELNARLLTVPKDSRGPRVISCEPKEFQWIQQGIREALYNWIERHPRTRGHIRFRDQSVNGKLALSGSASRDWATLDLSEASDRVSMDYVSKVTPEWVLPYLIACRSSGTVLPSGEVLELRKFAPMGSALCFPVLALTIWTRLHVAGISDCHVYGDDVIVRRTQVPRAIAALTEIGLKVNQSKSCYTGFFRESCGVDAFKGVDVTPARICTRWRNRLHPGVFTSWISYANTLYEHGYTSAATYVAEELGRIYGPIPQALDQGITCPGFSFLVAGVPVPKLRPNKKLQRMEHFVWTIRPVDSKFRHNGWTKLLHWFTSKANQGRIDSLPGQCTDNGFLQNRSSGKPGNSTSWYTDRGDVVFVRKWTERRLIEMHKTAK